MNIAKHVLGLFLVALLLLSVYQFFGCGSGGGSGTTTTTTTTNTSTTTASSTSTSSTSTSTSTTTTSTTTTTMGTGPATFLFSAMDAQNIGYIIPLGNTNPPEHTLPTDHIYLLFKDPNATYEVYFPASGELHAIEGGNDYKVTVRCSTSFDYYLGHVQSLESIYSPYIGNNNISGVTVAAGQKVGTTGKNNFSVVAMDLGVVDTDVTRTGFINAGNYLDEETHCGAPLSYYVDPLKSTLNALVDRAGTTDKDGKIDFDQAGKLIGNWFATDLVIPDPTTQKKSDGHNFGAKQIAFVYYNRNATREVISIGGEITGEGVSRGLYCAQTGATSFENISSSTGTASFELYAYNDLSTQLGNLLVRYNANDTISVEASSSALSSFSAAVKTYTR